MNLKDDNDHLKEEFGEVTKDGTVKNTKVLSEKIKGDTAIVRFELNFDDGTYQRRTMDLVKINDKWMLIFDELRDDDVPEPDEKDIVGTWVGIRVKRIF